MSKKKIVFAATNRISKYPKEIRKILLVLGHPEALVTDESAFWDFECDKEDMKLISEKLGVSVVHNNKLVDIAELMSEK